MILGFSGQISEGHRTVLPPHEVAVLICNVGDEVLEDVILDHCDSVEDGRGDVGDRKGRESLRLVV